MRDLNDTKLASREMLEEHRRNMGPLLETTPGAVSEGLLEFCGELSREQPVFVPVVGDPNGLYGWCVDGVAEKIKKDGGQHVFGWTIWECPGILWTAEFHDVWADKGGMLLDITPKPGREQKILFIPDRNYPQDFDFDRRPGNRRRRIYAEVDRRELVGGIISGMGKSQLQYEMRRAEKYGLSLNDWVLRKLPCDPIPNLIDSMIAACHAHEDYFDSLGSSGMVQVDRRLLALVRSRAAALQSLLDELRARGHFSVRR